MARPKSPKKSILSNEPVVPSIPSVLSTSNASIESTPAVATEPIATKPTAPKVESRRPEIVKKDTRANLVPINLDEEIRRLAYLLSERRGFTPGHEAEDWITAEREIQERYHQHSA